MRSTHARRRATPHRRHHHQHLKHPKHPPGEPVAAPPAALRAPRPTTSSRRRSAPLPRLPTPATRPTARNGQEGGKKSHGEEGHGQDSHADAAAVDVRRRLRRVEPADKPKRKRSSKKAIAPAGPTTRRPTQSPALQAVPAVVAALPGSGPGGCTHARPRQGRRPRPPTTRPSPCPPMPVAPMTATASPPATGVAAPVAGVTVASPAATAMPRARPATTPR